MKRIYTGSYSKCKAGNLISISKDSGKDAEFIGKAMLALAPKENFLEHGVIIEG